MPPPASALVIPTPVSCKRLFVYGTLLSAYVPQGEAPVIPPPTLRTARKLGAAVLRGFQLCELSKYPCIVRTGVPIHLVHGEVYEITDECVDWAVLDEYEGISEDEPQPHEYRREKVVVELKGGASCEAQAYVYNRDDANTLKVVSSGSFIDFYNAKHRGGANHTCNRTIA